MSPSPVTASRTFAAPQPITDDTASQRFYRLIFDRAGTLYAAWIDKREVAPARAAGKTPIRA